MKKVKYNAEQRWWESDTRFKFDEATYFYTKLIDLEEQADAEHLFVIDAFLLSFTSIFYIMQNEYDIKRDKNFKKWFEQNVGISKKVGERKRLVVHDLLIDKVISSRHETNHEGQYQPVFGSTIDGEFIMFNFNDNNIDDNLDIPELFKKVLDSTEKLISDCESKFTN